MATDYKHRASARGRNRAPISKWLIVLSLTGVFVFFLSFLRENDPAETRSASQTDDKLKKISELKKPEFQFYTILEQEQEIPDYEIKIRKRERQLGREKKLEQYILQAGSFKSFSEADKRKAQLALLGVESRIEKTKIGQQVWNRVNIGPISNIANVDYIRSQLRHNNIDVVVSKGTRR